MNTKLVDVEEVKQAMKEQKEARKIKVRVSEGPQIGVAEGKPVYKERYYRQRYADETDYKFVTGDTLFVSEEEFKNVNAVSKVTRDPLKQAAYRESHPPLLQRVSGRSNKE